MKLCYVHQGRYCIVMSIIKMHTGAPSSPNNIVRFENTKPSIWMYIQVVARCLYSVQTCLALSFFYRT